MDYYPQTVIRTRGSKVSPRKSTEVDVSTSGQVRGISLYDNDPADIVVEHDLIHNTDMQLILDFWNTHKALEFYYQDPITQQWYQAIFTAKPVIDWISPDVFKVTSKLTGYEISDPTSP